MRHALRLCRFMAVGRLCFWGGWSCTTTHIIVRIGTAARLQAAVRESLISIIEGSPRQNLDEEVLLEALEERAQPREPLIVDFQAADSAIEARAIRAWRHRGHRHSLIVLPTRRPAATPPSVPISTRLNAPSETRLIRDVCGATVTLSTCSICSRIDSASVGA